jgi:hypothetical protein
VALHLPHPRLDAAPSTPEPSSEAERFAVSRRLLHRKRHGFESELFIHCWNSLVFPQLLRRLEQLVLLYELPPYPPSFNQWVASRYVGSGASLLLGTDYPWLARQFPVTSPSTASLGFGFSRVDEVRAAAARAGLRLQPEPGQQSGGPTVFRVVPSLERSPA